MTNTKEANKDLIHLQNAHVTQNINGPLPEDKSDWVVRKNMTYEDLGSFPKNLTEEQVFSILHFARDFELTAFNIGIAHGKQVTVKVYQHQVDELKRRLQAAIEENERLAGILDKHIGAED